MIDIELLKKIREVQNDKGTLLDVVAKQDKILNDCYKELVTCYKAIISLVEDL